MTALESPQVNTAASVQAGQNWDANLAALAVSQSYIVEAADSPALNLTWLFGRDGFLTAQDSLGQWWAGCSLPKRAGTTMLKKLDLRGVVGCLLAPTHAGQVTAALETLATHQAVIVVHPDTESIRVLLGCCDYSADIARHRLWFAIGEQWPEMMGRLLREQPGLSTPCQFIRTPATDEDLIQTLIPMAEKVFNECNAARSIQLSELASGSPPPGVPGGRVRVRGNFSQVRVEQSGEEKTPHPSPPPGVPGGGDRNGILRVGQSVLVLAASHFRLWDDAGDALSSAMRSTDINHLDPDDPAQSSALGLALAGQHRDAVIVPNRSRAELPAVFSASTSVLTWITQPRIPAYDGKHPNDGLLLADDTWLTAATSLGWPLNRLKIAGWPNLPSAPSAEKSLALIADTFTLDTPVKALDSSSHHVLWEVIRSDLNSDPFAIGTDVIGFIHRRMTKLGISQEGFNEPMFINRLVIPAYQQGLARLLLDAGLPLKLFGRGWDLLPRLSAAWRGEVRTREEFRGAVNGASVLMYPWPTRVRHEIDAMGRPVLSPNLRRAESWVRDAKAILNGCRETLPFPPISQALIRDMVNSSSPV